jgi:hypothetical protein
MTRLKSAFGPEAVKAMGEAFDQAWAEIAGNFGDSPLQIEGARLRLAAAVLSSAAQSNTDVGAIKADALHVMLVDYRWRIRPAA